MLLFSQITYTHVIKDTSCFLCRHLVWRSINCDIFANGERKNYLGKPYLFILFRELKIKDYYKITSNFLVRLLICQESTPLK